MGRRRQHGRNVTGILLLNKAAGLSSNEALQQVKRLFRARKAGHTGSLDKLATGLLPICFGEATKMSGFLLNSDKHYRATFRLGEKTRTGDTEGEVMERRPVPPLTAPQIEEAMARFRGEIQQIPPMHSAIKQGGQPLYKLAHQGLEVEREPRTVTIHGFELIAQRDDELDVDVRCSKGTYIRTLAEDLGEFLGCGAHVSVLHRIGAGPFDAGQMVTVEELQDIAAEGTHHLDKLLLPADTAVAEWPEIRLSKDLSFYMHQGQAVMVPRAPTSGWVRLYDVDKGFIGAGEVLDDGRIAPRRLLAGHG